MGGYWHAVVASEGRAGEQDSLLALRFREIPLDFVLDGCFRAFIIVQVRAQAGFPPDIQSWTALLVHIYRCAALTLLAHQDDLLVAPQPVKTLLECPFAELFLPPIR